MQTQSGRQRFVDIQPYSNYRVISMPARELGEFDNRVSSSAVFSKAFGEDEYHKYAALYNEAQITATSVIRKYRNDLSLNRAKQLREQTRTTAYTFVTVFPLKGPVFESLWLKAFGCVQESAAGYQPPQPRPWSRRGAAIRRSAAFEKLWGI